MINYAETASVAVTAAGSTLATATALQTRFNNVTTVAASTGVSLPYGAQPGELVYVRNGGANALNVYPATALGTVNGGSAGAAVSLATTTYKTQNSLFYCLGNDLWVQFVGA